LPLHHSLIVPRIDVISPVTSINFDCALKNRAMPMCLESLPALPFYASTPSAKMHSRVIAKCVTPLRRCESIPSLVDIVGHTRSV